MDHIIPELTTKRHSLFLTILCLFMVHFTLGPFLLKIAKKIENIGLLEKVNQKTTIIQPNKCHDEIICLLNDRFTF